MNEVALVEYVEAVFIGIALLGQYNTQDNSNCVKWLKICLTAELFSLFTDALSYSYTATSSSFYYIFSYVINLLAYTAGELIIIFFAKYCEAYISSKTRLKPKIFRIPIILTVVSIGATVYEYIAGHIIVYKNNIDIAEYGVPVYIRVIQFIVIIYIASVTVSKRKAIGAKAIFLLCFYYIAPVAAVIASYFTNLELSVISAAVALILVTTILQKDMTLKQLEQNAVDSALEEKTEKIRKEQIAKLSGAESLYIVDREKNTLQIMYQSSQHSGTYASAEKYDDVLEKYVENEVFESDRKRMLEALNISTLAEKLEKEGEYKAYYRNISSGVPLWYEFRALTLSSSEFLISFTDNNQNIVLNNFQNMVNEDFFALFSVNLDTDIITVLKSPGYYPTVEEGKTAVYSQVIKEYALTQEGETRAVFLRLADLENVRRVLFTEKKRSYSYKSALGSQTEWITVSTYVISKHEDDTPEEFILSFSVIDKFGADSHELRERLKEINHIIGALTDDYSSVYYVELYNTKLDNKTIIYRDSDYLKKHIPEWENESNFSKRLDLLNANLIYEEDRASFIAETRRERVLEVLEKSDIDYINFRMLIDSEIRFYQLKMSVIKENGKMTGFVAGIHSMDKQMKKEKEHQLQLETKQKELQKALEAAQTANKAKTSFLFNMSHDIRTPLNAIIGFTDIALKHTDDESRVEDCLNKIQLSGSLLLSLINDILDMSRIESGKIQPDEKTTDIYNSFDSIQATLIEMAENKNIRLSFVFENITDRYVLMDVGMCIRVFVNIITNAVKYTNEGGVISVKCEQAGKEDEKGIYRFIFEDNGIGMSEDFRKHAFEEFTREKTSTISGIQGTGLGLAVCRSFTHAMNGTIECSSVLGKGSKFTVTLPLKICEHYENEIVSEKENLVKEDADEETRKTSLAGKVVLLVEDNELNREIACDILEEEKMIVETAVDGSVAVQMMKEKGDYYYDIVLMDIQMPVMNGYEATREIRKMYPDSNVPIIALSANAFEEDRIASLSAGMNDHVGKPINIRNLTDTIEKYL